MSLPSLPSSAWPVGEPLPALLSAAQLRRVFDISESTFLRWQRIGRFRAFEVSADVGVRRYSGLLVQRYLDGATARTFGQKRA